ncbi:hypothetical protein GCM10010452_01460 [Crossiella cryophila]
MAYEIGQHAGGGCGAGQYGPPSRLLPAFLLPPFPPARRAVRWLGGGAAQHGPPVLPSPFPLSLPLRLTSLAPALPRDGWWGG